MFWRFVFFRLIPGAWLRSNRLWLNRLYYWFADKSFWSDGDLGGMQSTEIKLTVDWASKTAQSWEDDLT